MSIWHSLVLTRPGEAAGHPVCPMHAGSAVQGMAGLHTEQPTRSSQAPRLTLRSEAESLCRERHGVWVDFPVTQRREERAWNALHLALLLDREDHLAVREDAGAFAHPARGAASLVVTALRRVTASLTTAASSYPCLSRSLSNGKLTYP